jgi:hypothetical protein
MSGEVSTAASKETERKTEYSDTEKYIHSQEKCVIL